MVPLVLCPNRVTTLLRPPKSHHGIRLSVVLHSAADCSGGSIILGADWL